MDTNDKPVDHINSVGAYALLGFLLGAFVPLSGFLILSYNAPPAAASDWSESVVVRLFLFVNFICAIAGPFVGAAFGALLIPLRRLHWSLPVILAPLCGALWGIATGGAGGFPVFVVGALFGAIIAAPIGAAGFLLFALVYEYFLRRRGGRLPGWRAVTLTAAGATLVVIAGGHLWMILKNTA